MKGIRISKAGANVLSAKPQDLYVDSNTPLYMVAQQANGVMTFNSSEVNSVKRVTINHNLNYEPLYAVYAERVSGSGTVRWADSSGLRLGSDTIFVKSGVTTTQLLIDFVSFPADPTGNYRYYYYIFYNQGDKG